MYPTLLETGAFAIHSYGTLFVAGLCLAATLLAVVVSKEWPQEARVGLPATIGLAIVATLFAPLAALVCGVSWFRNREKRACALFGAYALVGTITLLLAVLFGGGLGLAASWPVLSIGCVVAAAVGVALHFGGTVHFLRLLDGAVAGGCLGHAVQKLGCFLAGCCGGTVSDSGLALRFPPRSSVAWEQVHQDLIEQGEASLPVHPHQLYSLVAYLIVGATVFLVATRTKAPRGVAGGAGLVAAVAAYVILLSWRDLGMM